MSILISPQCVLFEFAFDVSSRGAFILADRGVAPQSFVK